MIKTNVYDEYSSYGGCFLSSMSDSYKQPSGTFGNTFLTEIISIPPTQCCIPVNAYFMNLNTLYSIYPFQNYVTKLKTTSALIYQAGASHIIANSSGGFLSPSNFAKEIGNFAQTGVTDVDYGQNMVGSNVLDLEGGGHYQLSISTIPQSELLGDREIISVSAIIPKQYTSSNTITQYSNTSVPYIHFGASITLNLFNCRVINPNNKQCVEDSALGDNSYFYLQIDKPRKAQTKSEKLK